MFRIAAEAYNGFAVLATTDGGISFLNCTALKNLCLRPADLIGRPLGAFIRRADGKPFPPSEFRPGKSKYVRSRDFTVRGRDGSRIPCRGRVYYFSADDTRREEILILCNRTDDRDVAGDDLFSDGLDLRSFSDSIPDGVCILDDTGKIRAANSSLPLLLGVERKKVVGSTIPYPWHSGDEAAGILDALRDAQKKGPVLGRHIRGKAAGDRPVVLSYSFSPLGGFPPPGRPLFVATIRDVTGEYAAHESGMYVKRIERLKQQVRRNAIRLKTLQDINTSVLRSGSLPAIFRRITGGIGKLVDHDLAGIYVIDMDEKILRPHTLSKQTTFSRKLAKFPLPFGEGIIGSAAISGETILVNDAQHDPRSKYPPGMKPPVEHIIAAPLRGRTSTYGILVVARNRQPRFQEEDALVVKSFADAANVALENARLYHELAQLKPRGPRSKQSRRHPATTPGRKSAVSRPGPNGEDVGDGSREDSHGEAGRGDPGS